MFRNIVVGMSGGVDSAVAALLLKHKGFNVTGVFLRNWDTADETGKCLADEDLKYADWISKKLSIPLIEVNFVKEYWNDVFTYLLESYQTGRTPNPDIICNKKIKFNKFYEYATNIMKADAVATGHYANSSFGAFLESYKPNCKVKLLKPADDFKDQTFFLSQVCQEPLQKWMFPLANYMKKDVKKMAIESGLDKVAQKAESMGICFIGTRTFQNFITEYIENKPGNFIDYETGKIVGQHQGIHCWTRGQRSRIPGHAKAYFVYKIIAETNEILVVPGTDHPALFSQILVTSKPHWIYEEPPELASLRVLECGFRYQRIEPIVPCQVFKTQNEQLIIVSEHVHKAVTSGQFAVLYRDNECLGSAPIAFTGPSLHSLEKLTLDRCESESAEISSQEVKEIIQ